MVLLEEISEDEEQYEYEDRYSHSEDDSASDQIDSEDDFFANPVKSDEVKDETLKKQATGILETARGDPSTLPDVLLEILTNIIKPLFSNKHPQLTSTGRKNLVPAPTVAGAFNYDSLFDDARAWKNGWTTDILQDLLKEYNHIEAEHEKKSTIEAHFHLVVPPILHLLDDMETPYKISGCRCLSSLCDLLVQTKSGMMKRTGLADVFLDALRKMFTYLPTLTPEDESLALMQAVYPTYYDLVDARFAASQEQVSSVDQSITTGKSTSGSHLQGQLPNSSLYRSSGITDVTTTKAQPPASNSTGQSSQSPITFSPTENALRESMLTIILRHSLLYSLSHLSTGVGTSDGIGTNTTSIPITTYLFSQIGPIATKLDIWGIVSHLQVLLPLLKNIIVDPFVLSVASTIPAVPVSKSMTTKPDMLCNAIQAMSTLTMICAPRIRERWFGECLAAAVGCWLNILDDEDEDEDDNNENEDKPISNPETESNTSDPVTSPGSASNKNSNNTSINKSQQNRNQKSKSFRSSSSPSSDPQQQTWKRQRKHGTIQKEILSLMANLKNVMNTTEMSRLEFQAARRDILAEVDDDDPLRGLFD